MSASTANSAGSLMGTLFPILLIAAMLFFMFWSQRKRGKKEKNMLESIKVGDKIRTIGGFYGEVEQVKEDFFVIRLLPDETRATIAKGAVATVENSDVESSDVKTD